MSRIFHSSCALQSGEVSYVTNITEGMILPSLKTFDSKKFIPRKHIELHPTTLL